MDNIFKYRIKEERLRLNLNQEELGNKAGLSKQTISHYERGTKNPTVETISKLADIFDCSIDYLLGRTNNRNSETFSGVVDGDKYTFEIDRLEPDKPDTEEKFNRLVRKLKAVGFDVDKLMENQIDIDLEND